MAPNERWLVLMRAAQDRWTRLSADDLLSVAGNAERLISLLQSHYGWPRRDALRELSEWSRELRAQARPMRAH